MPISRRDLLRSAGAAGSALALGSFGLAEAAVAGTGGGRTTLDRVLAKGKKERGGWRPLVAKAGEPHQARTNLAAAQAGRETRRQALLAFAQLSDVHIVDAQSPMRFEAADDTISSSAYRPQEILTAHIAEAMVRELNEIATGPVSASPLAFAIQTGDNSDNSQFNEIRWNIDLLDGGEVRPDSGDLSRYEGVMDNHPDYYDPFFYHPHGTPKGQPTDRYRKDFGFPEVPGLLDAARKPFTARGLSMPWYTALGNHDQLVQGNFPQSAPQNATATGSVKATTRGPRTVTPDADRRLLDRAATVEEHFTTTGLPAGHGFTEQNRADGTAYYTSDHGLVRLIVLDTVNANGGDDGSLDSVQFAWLQEQLTLATDKLVVVASHHASWTMVNTLGGGRVLGPAVVAALLDHDNVIAWINGHTHRNEVRPQTRESGGGFWEINTAAHVDWPQQSRLLEIMDNQDGTLSIFTTMVDHGAPLKKREAKNGPLALAALGRLLAANDFQERGDKRRGLRRDRNVELLVPAPAWLSAD